MAINILLWYLSISLIGWLAFPLAYHLLRFLPDRGLALARPLGLLLSGYLYWLLVSLGVLQNDAGGVFFAVLAVGLLSAAVLWINRAEGGWGHLRAWLTRQRSQVLATELLFLLAFAAWTVVRAANPAADTTEKPMELAFINAILRSPAFPPSDPWLSGYAISYYYFGYVIVAMLARLSLSTGGVAFNLGLASWFAMTALAAYGLVYNLLALRAAGHAPNGAEDGNDRLAALLARARRLALFAPLALLLLSNLEGPLEVMHARGLFWSGLEEGNAQSGFWSWLNVEELDQPPSQPLSWEPGGARGWWWWRASRVVRDFDLAGGSREIIDEFPAFSYLLGDLHPHVLTMPFALLAVGLALNVFVKIRAVQADAESTDGVLKRTGLSGWPAFFLVSLIIGGLAFLNTWDFPIYLALFAAAVILARYLQEGFRWSLAVDFVLLAAGLAFVGILLYLPFYLGFASQANGLVPSLIFFTRGAYFWVMFGTLLLPILAWLGWTWRRKGTLPRFLQGVMFAAGVTFGLWALSSLWAALVLSRDPGLAGLYAAVDGTSLIQEAFLRRIQSPGAWLSLFFLLALVWGLFQAFRSHGETAVPDRSTALAESQPDRSAAFVLLLVLLGSGLVLFPEFFYLRDQFGTRMNTIFKFYFQAWIVWSASAAYAVGVLWEEVQSTAARLAFRAAWVVLVLMALIYPFYGTLSMTNGLRPSTWTLDGSAHLEQYYPEDLEAIRWLRDAPYGVVAEAVGGQYTAFARVATHSGLPGVLGWPGHEGQWRGGYKEVGSREPDLERLYRSRSWDQAREVLEKYNIRYVYVGGLEQSTYRPNTALFDQYLNPVFTNSSVTIYEYSSTTDPSEQARRP